MNHFSESIIYWYELNKRDLPWRKTKDPFKIWLSEIIMQQTRINQGLPYYHKFTERFKGIKSLAEAPEEEVMKLWQGLGYYSRARNLHTAARQLMSEFEGKFPADHAKLLSIKGIGEYSAAAIASFAFDLPYPVLDGNVYRVMARYALIDDPVNSGSGKKKINQLLNGLMDKHRPGSFNQAMMELGATVCIPRNPLCKDCPLSLDCKAFNEFKTGQYPVKAKKDAALDRYMHYIIPLLEDNNIWYTLLRQREPGDIWAGLFEFPLIESDHQLNLEELTLNSLVMDLFQFHPYTTIHFSKTIDHQLSHRNIHAKFWILEIRNQTLYFDNDVFTLIYLKDLFKYPVSRLIDRYLSTELIINILKEKNEKVKK